jgi:hypothetical protein
MRETTWICGVCEGLNIIRPIAISGARLRAWFIGVYDHILNWRKRSPKSGALEFKETCGHLITVTAVKLHRGKVTEKLLMSREVKFHTYIRVKVSLLGPRDSASGRCSELDEYCQHVIFYVFLCRALWYTYVITIYKMHTFFTNDLIKVYCLRLVSNNQVFILRKTCTCNFMVYLMYPYKQSGRCRMSLIPTSTWLLTRMHEKIP